MRRHVAEVAADGYFASGLNDPGEVRGVALAGYHVGISCSELRGRLLDEVEAVVRDLGCRVFVDSGAFSEVEVVDGALVVARPLAAQDWDARLTVYARLAASCGPKALLVAPDRVGDQEVTLALLATYAPRLRALRTIHGDPFFGPTLIVPVQRGAMTQGAFADAALDALSLAADEVTWGVPMKKHGTSLLELSAFASSRMPGSSFHLLGMGPSSDRFEAAVLTLQHHCPGAVITCDAARIAALVGRESGLRPITAAQDRARTRTPGATSSRVKREAIVEVLGAESVALLRDAGWSDPELPHTRAELTLEVTP